jgi:Leucine-rich repeat (LRR) protein
LSTSEILFSKGNCCFSTLVCCSMNEIIYKRFLEIAKIVLEALLEFVDYLFHVFLRSILSEHFIKQVLKKWNEVSHSYAINSMLSVFLLRKIILILLVCAISSSHEASLKRVACESIEDVYWTLGTQRSCTVQRSAIDSKGFYFLSSRDESVGGLQFNHNSLIRFLPDSPAHIFPNLVVYGAHDCSIESISKENFDGLSQLRGLYLSFNHIVEVSSDTFEDLKALEVLFLGKNFKS